MSTLLDIVKNPELTSIQKQEHIAALGSIDRNEEKDADALICAASAGDNALLQYLLNSGLDVNSKNADRWTVFLQTAAHNGAECTVCGKGGSPDMETIHIVLAAHPNLHTTIGRFNRTALDWSAFRGKTEYVQVIIKHASHELTEIEFVDYINHPSFRGKAPLHLTAQHGDIATSKVILENGARINATCFAQQTALHLATSNQHLNMVQFLLSHHPPVDVNAKMADGTTALHLAVETGRLDIVEAILSQEGVLTNERNALSYTPLLKARELDNEDISNILVDHVFHIERSTPAYKACELYRASVTDFFVSVNKDNFADTYKAPVKRVLYDNIRKARRGPEIPPKNQAPTKDSYMSLQFQWTDLPSNNIAWAETFITKRCMRGAPTEVPDYTRLLTTLYQVQNRFKLHSRQLKPDCKMQITYADQIELFGELYMPYLRWQTDEAQQQLRTTLEKIEASDALVTKDLGKEEALLQGYIVPGSTTLHLRRTLDQFRYPAMSTRARDRDQVVYRHYLRRYEATKDEKWKTPRIYMVDQLWLWSIPDKIVTCMPGLGGDGRDVRNDVIYDINVHGDQVSDRMDLIAIIFDRCLGLFDRHYPDQRELRFFEQFEWSLGDITEKANSLLKDFESDISKVTRWLDKKTSLSSGIEDDELATKTKKDDKADAADEEHLLFVNRLIDISQETKLHFECVDMDDELISLSMVLKQQEMVVSQFWSPIVDSRPTTTNDSKLQKYLRHKEILRHDQAEIERLRTQINDVERILSELLNMKPRYATAIEARFTRDQAEDTARQGQVLMVFTIVTIIFLPLSFLSAFFAINIAAFPRVGDGYLSLGWVSKYVFGIGLGFSVPLIVIAFAFGDLALWKQRLSSMLSRNKKKKSQIAATKARAGPVGVGTALEAERASISSIQRLRGSIRPRSLREKDEESGET